jgi:hypothetical protein
VNKKVIPYTVFLVSFFACIQGLAQDTTGTIVILSEKIGPVIDQDERKFYQMFMNVQDFESAVLLQRTDGSFTFKVIKRKTDAQSVLVQWIPMTTNEIESVRKIIEAHDGIQNEASQSADDDNGRISGEAFPMAHSPDYKKVCFQGKPYADCGSFYLTEIGVRYNLTRNHAGKAYRFRCNLPYTSGWMKNTGSRSAFGGVIGLDIDFSAWHGWFCFGPRYRYWLTQSTSLDCMSSVMVGSSGSNVNFQAIWMYKDEVGIEAGLIFNTGNEGGQRNPVRPYVGVRLGSYPAFAAYGLTAFVLILFFTAMQSID